MGESKGFQKDTQLQRVLEDICGLTAQIHHSRSDEEASSNDTLSDLVDIAQIQKLAESHYKAAGMPIGIIDARSGVILVGVGWQDICLHFHRAHPDSARCCTESDRYINNRMVDGKPCAYKCQNGLWDIGIPILVEGQHLATLFLGQFLYEGESPDRDFFIRQAERFGYDLFAYLAALDRIPVFGRETVNNILDYNVAFANFIADLACKKKRLERELDERRRTEEAVLKANRVINALGECNNVLIRAKDESQLLQEICRIIVEVGGYRMAWVGYAEHDAGRTVTPVARYGYEDGYLEKISVTWEDNELGRGPVGISIRTGTSSVVRHVELQSNFVPWREEAVKRGYVSVIGLPLFVEGCVLGSLAIYAVEPDAFDADEVNLLSKLGMNLSFGITTLRTSHARKQAEIALQRAHDELEKRVGERTAELAAVNEQLKFLSSRLLAAQEEERKKLAGELHDSIGSSLSAVKFGLENTRNRLQEGVVVPESFDDLIYMVKQAIDEARRIYMDLRPSMLDDLGIIPTLGWFCRQFQSIYTGIHIESEIGLEEEEIPGPIKIVIFRIVQESLNNIAKYSKANLVNLSLVKNDDATELIIEDNGVGFDLNSIKLRKDYMGGMGLTSMRERAELSGGVLAVGSIPGKGTRVCASWPDA